MAYVKQPPTHVYGFNTRDMLTLRYLLYVAAAVAATAAVAVSLMSIQPSDLPHLAKAVAAEALYKSNNVYALSHYVVYYKKIGGRWILVDEPGHTPPLYTLAVGSCPSISPILNKTYTPNNNTVVFERCALVTPWISEAGGEVVLTHYYAPCKTVDFFKPEVVESTYIYDGLRFRIRLVLVC